MSAERPPPNDPSLPPFTRAQAAAVRRIENAAGISEDDAVALTEAGVKEEGNVSVEYLRRAFAGFDVEVEHFLAWCGALFEVARGREANGDSLASILGDGMFEGFLVGLYYEGFRLEPELAKLRADLMHARSEIDYLAGKNDDVGPPEAQR